MPKFHETYGYYAQGVSVVTAILPAGWRDRLVSLDTPATVPAADLRRLGLSTRNVGEILGISGARVAQIERESGAA